MTGSSWGMSLQNIRWWSFFAIFIALLATSSIFMLHSILKKTKMLFIGMMILLVIGLIYTSAIPRYKVQTMGWMPGGNWLNVEQLNSYVHLKDLGYDHKILPICGRPEKINAFNQLTPTWEYETMMYYQNLINISPLTINSTDFINNMVDVVYADNYEYVLLEVECLTKIGENATLAVSGYFDNNPNFSFMQDYSNGQFILLRVI